MLTYSALFALLLLGAHSINMFNKYQLTTKNGASCLDGSPYAIYTYLPDTSSTNADVNKLLIFWEQTDFGWCFKQDLASTLQQCYKFITEDPLTDFASSDNWGGSELFLNGILSITQGGIFSNWPKVLIKSCDGGSYLGNHAPISYKNKKLHFRGSQNIKQAVNYLNSINFLKNRQEIVMVGSFNAGIAALLWSDYFKSQTTGSLRIIADATLFQNSMNYKLNRSVIQNRLKQIEEIALVNNSLPNSACAARHTGELWRCLFTEELVKYVPYPIYFLQSLYDGWEIVQILGFTCVELATLSECKKEERQIIDQYHANVTESLNNIIQLHDSHGAFAIACVCHQFLGGKWDYEAFEVPMNSGHRPITVTQNWVSGKSKEIYIDAVDWPNNKPCARKASPPPQNENRLTSE